MKTIGIDGTMTLLLICVYLCPSVDKILNLVTLAIKRSLQAIYLQLNNILHDCAASAE